MSNKGIEKNNQKGINIAFRFSSFNSQSPYNKNNVFVKNLRLSVQCKARLIMTRAKSSVSVHP